MFNQKERTFFYNIYWLALVLLLLLVQTSPAIAKPVEVGRVLMATLGVTAETSATDSRALTRRSAIFVGDTLKTPAGGRAQLRMADGEMISLMESSELFIEDFQYNSDEANNDTDTNVKNLVTGGLRVITGAVKGKNYEMKSRAGTIGIRGTSFEAFTQQGENLYVRMLSGRVYVRNQQGGVEIGFNQPLSAVRVARFNSPPEAILPTQLPAFFENAFSAGTNLSRSGDQPRFSASQLGLDGNPLALQGNQSQEQNQQPTAGQLGLNDNLQAANEQIARERVAREQAAREQAAREQAAREQAAREQAAREQAAREQAEREKKQPLGYVVGTDQAAAISYTGQFTEEAVTINSSAGTFQATGQGGTSVLGVTNTVIDFDFNSYDLEKFTLGSSTIHLGNTGYLRDSNELLLETVTAVFSTNIHNTIDSLPGSNTTDYRYELISLNGPLQSGALDVNFSTGNIDVELLKKDSIGNFIGSGSVSDFYNDSINLFEVNDGLQGKITGRFVGGNAEGAIAAYKLDFSDADYMGVAVFDRTNTYPTYQNIPEISFGYVVGSIGSEFYSGSFMNTPISIMKNADVEMMGQDGTGVLGLNEVNEFIYQEYDSYIKAGFLQLNYAEISLAIADSNNSAWVYLNGGNEQLDDGAILVSTNVHNTIDSLPSVGDYQYNLFPSLIGGYTGGLDSGSLTVDFSTGVMGVSLLTPDNEYTGTGQVADFYNTAINLNSDTPDYYTGSINGRFIGDNAEGAITIYSLSSSAINPMTGVAIFDRTGQNPPPAP